MIGIPHGTNWRWNWISSLVRQHNWKTGGELGVKQGRCTAFLLSMNPQLHMTCVDLWDVQPDQADVVGGETYETWDNDGYFNAFSQSMNYTFPNRTMVHRMYTHDAAALVDDESLDFIFIDADHSFEGVARDIRDWKSKVKSTGAILGHDYSWPTVQQAINQELSDPSLVFTGLNNCWGIWKKDV